MRIGQYQRQVDLPGPAQKRAQPYSPAGKILEGFGELGQQTLDFTADLGQKLGQIEHRKKVNELERNWNEFYEQNIAGNSDPETYMELFEEFSNEDGPIREIRENIRNPWARDMFEQSSREFLEENRHRLQLEAIKQTQRIGFEVNRQAWEEYTRSGRYDDAREVIAEAWDSGQISEVEYNQWAMQTGRQERKANIFDDTLAILHGEREYNGETGEQAAKRYLQSDFPMTEGPGFHRNVHPEYYELLDQGDELARERSDLRNELLSAQEQGNEERAKEIESRLQSNEEETERINRQRDKLLEGTEALEFIGPREREELRGQLDDYLTSAREANENDAKQYANWVDQELTTGLNNNQSPESLLNTIRHHEDFSRLRNDNEHDEIPSTHEKWVLRLQRMIEEERGEAPVSEKRIDEHILGYFFQYADDKLVDNEFYRAYNQLLKSTDANGEPKEVVSDMDRISELIDGRPTADKLWDIANNVTVDRTNWEQFQDLIMGAQPEGPEQVGFETIDRLTEEGEINNLFPEVEDEDTALMMTRNELRGRYVEELKNLRSMGADLDRGAHQQIIENLTSEARTFSTKKMLDQYDPRQELERRGGEDPNIFQRLRNMFGSAYKGDMLEQNEHEKVLESIQAGEFLGVGERYEDVYSQLYANNATDIMAIAQDPDRFRNVFGLDPNGLMRRAQRIDPALREEDAGWNARTIAGATIQYDGGPVIVDSGDGYLSTMYMNVPSEIGDLKMRVFLRSRDGRNVNPASFDPKDWELAYMPEIPSEAQLQLTSDDPHEQFLQLYNKNTARPWWEKERETSQSRSYNLPETDSGRSGSRPGSGVGGP